MTLFHKVSVDLPAVDSASAATLIFHHLQMAAALFEALPEETTLEALLASFEREADGWGVIRSENPPLLAGTAFLETIFEYYQKLDREVGR